MNNIFSFLPIIVILPIISILFILMCPKNKPNNIYNVSILAIVANIIVSLRFFSLLDISDKSLQLVARFAWLQQPKIEIIFGVDIFALLLILAIHFAFLITLTGIKKSTEKPKAMTTLAMLFLSMITGFLISADIFSFYMFFEAMLLPLFMLTGIAGEVKRQDSIYRFFLYNIFGAVLLFVATSVLFNYSHGSVELSKVHLLGFENKTQYFIWGAIFVALLSRLPLWPFHYWIASINSGIKNPLVFLVSNLIPMTAIYAFIRILPINISLQISLVITVLKIIAIISLLFISLIGLVHKDFQYKIFSCLNVYYIFYLLAIFITKSNVLLNIGFAFFALLIGVSALEVLWYKVSHFSDNQNKSMQGVLSTSPKLIFIFGFFILVLIGAPISSMFLNNFVILSKLLSSNFIIASVIMFSLLITSVSLIGEFLRFSSPVSVPVTTPELPRKTIVFMGFIIFVLIMSFIKPLWFVGF